MVIIITIIINTLFYQSWLFLLISVFFQFNKLFAYNHCEFFLINVLHFNILLTVYFQLTVDLLNLVINMFIFLPSYFIIIASFFIILLTLIFLLNLTMNLYADSEYFYLDHIILQSSILIIKSIFKMVEEIHYILHNFLNIIYLSCFIHNFSFFLM